MENETTIELKKKAGEVLGQNPSTSDNNNNRNCMEESEVQVDAQGVGGPVGLMRKRKANLPCIVYYNMDFKHRGYAVIVNNETFHRKTGLDVRFGSDVDARNLKRIFRKLGFQVDLQQDVSSAALKELTDKYAKEDHSNSDCFVLAILSHGDNGCVFGTDGTVKIKRIVDNFRGDQCPTLAGKPKIFMFQTCRGKEYETGVSVAHDVVDGISEDLGSDENAIAVDSGPELTIPSGSDFLFCYSVAEGFFSFRDKFFGSWYIDEFTNVMETLILETTDDQRQDVDFIDVLTTVSRRVAQRDVIYGGSLRMLGKKQMPCYLSMLTKKLYLHPKIPIKS